MHPVRSRILVSIHAPAWGATADQVAPYVDLWTFQSTHPRGVRPAKMRVVGTALMFQSTHPRGVRRSRFVPQQRRCWCFNPRTRVGCDSDQGWYVRWLVRFNPRTRVGCDNSPRFKMFRQTLFQSTHPRGVRRFSRPIRRTASAFQSTHPRGVRPAELEADDYNSPVSIHAPAWGATSRRLLCCIYTKTFQSTHPRGVRHPLRPLRITALLRFQSTHPRGVRLLLTSSVPCLWLLFQSTHPRGVRLCRI